MTEPVIIQGGMGVAVSDWKLVSTVARTGQLGVLSGTGLDSVFVRRLQLGDAGGHIRRALAHFPVPAIANRILERYYIAGGKEPETPFRLAPIFTARPSIALQQLTVVANFVEVFLAKEGHNGAVGINLLEKVQLPNLSSLYGAMLAGVDYVCMGAGIPREIPGALDGLSRHEKVSLKLHVHGACDEDDYRCWFDPSAVIGSAALALRRPKFLAIVGAAALALALARNSSGRVDGFVLEGHVAGGHNAPPRGPLRLSRQGEPVYGPRDEPDLAKMRALGVPFWLAGSYDSPGRLREALDAGACGVQVGTAFAFSRESGFVAEVKSQVVDHALRGQAHVFTDPRVSPAGFPFKVVSRRDSLSNGLVYAARRRVCDLGYLRQPYKRQDGTLGYRCPAEPALDYLRKGGRADETVGRKCLCNALMASVGLAQVRNAGYVEQFLVTAGDCLRALSRFGATRRPSYSALEVMEYLLQPA